MAELGEGDLPSDGRVFISIQPNPEFVDGVWVLRGTRKKGKYKTEIFSHNGSRLKGGPLSWASEDEARDQVLARDAFARCLLATWTKKKRPRALSDDGGDGGGAAAEAAPKPAPKQQKLTKAGFPDARALNGRRFVIYEGQRVYFEPRRGDDKAVRRTFPRLRNAARR